MADNFLSQFQIPLPKEYHSDCDLNDLLNDIILTQTTAICNYMICELSRSFNIPIDDLNEKFKGIINCTSAINQLKYVTGGETLEKRKKPSTTASTSASISTPTAFVSNQCMALTQKKTRCLKQASPGNKLCATHINKSDVQYATSTSQPSQSQQPPPSPKIGDTPSELNLCVEEIDGEFYLIDNDGNMYNMPSDIDIDNPIIDWSKLEKLKIN